jgi:hypothetical protein
VAEIRETRQLAVRQRVVTLTAVRQLAERLSDEYEATAGDHDRPDLSFSVACDDGSAFESSDVALFAPDSVVSKKRVERVTLLFRNYPARASIEIKLAHGDSQHGNSVVVYGLDSTWVNGTLKQLEETIASFPPQNTFVARHTTLVTTTIALGLGSLFVWTVRLIVARAVGHPAVPATKDATDVLIDRFPALLYLIQYGFSYLIGMFPAWTIVDRLKALWPDVELQIGPEHSQIQKKRRLVLASVMVLGVLPLVTNLLYDVLRTWARR